MATEYRIYGSPTPGTPIDYATPLDQTALLSWPTSALPAGTHRFGVRSVDTVGGLEESNVDAVVEITVDAGLNDVTDVPATPRGLVAVPTAGGGAHVTWSWPLGEPAPTGFHAYIGTPTPDYGTAAATIPATTGRHRYSADLTGLSEGTAHQVAVRAYNGIGEETNSIVVGVVGSAAGPANVQNLMVS
jgi:hypothetical protein